MFYALKESTTQAPAAQKKSLRKRIMSAHTCRQLDSPERDSFLGMTLTKLHYEIHGAYHIERKVQCTVTENLYESGQNEEDEDISDESVQFEDLCVMLDQQSEDHLHCPPNLVSSKDLEREMSEGATHKLEHRARAKCSAVKMKSIISPMGWTTQSSSHLLSIHPRTSEIGLNEQAYPQSPLLIKHA